MNPQCYIHRFYREWQNPQDLKSYRVHYRETNLQIYSNTNLLDRAYGLTVQFRNQIEETITKHPEFLTSLHPVELDSEYRFIKTMIQKSSSANVGPMAGVAGAFAEFVGMGLLPYTEDLIIENGGDIFIKSLKDRIMLVYAGEESPFKDRMKILLKGKEEPLGVCTSSKKVGHSKSFGNTDAVVIIASSAVTADVFATAAGNMVKTENDITRAMEFTQHCDEIQGGVIMIGEKMSVWGDIEFV